jgi:hypothetical protein
MSTPSKNPGPGAPDDLKAKFRDALARKNQRHEEHQAERAESVTQAHTGPAKAQRQFRRKSGG